MKILVATDGSLGSKAALRFAARLAGGLREAEIVVITVGALRHDLFLSRPENPAGLALQPELEHEEREIASRTLQAAERELKGERSRARFRFVQPRRIAQEADREKADLIVVGTDRYGAFASWALGSVSARLLQVARRPVTVVHVKKARAHTPLRRLA